MVRWYYVAPAAAVIVGGLFIISVWRVWFETWGKQSDCPQMAASLIPSARQGCRAGIDTSAPRLDNLAPLWQVILCDYAVTVAQSTLSWRGVGDPELAEVLRRDVEDE